MRAGWAAATSASVAVVLAVAIVYELVVLDPQGVGVKEAVQAHLFIALVAATAAGVAAWVRVAAVLLGSAAGTGVALLFAFASGNGPDEGDGFFWLTVASLGVSLMAAVVAVLVARRIRARACRPG